MDIFFACKKKKKIQCYSLSLSYFSFWRNPPSIPQGTFWFLRDLLFFCLPFSLGSKKFRFPILYFRTFFFSLFFASPNRVALSILFLYLMYPVCFSISVFITTKSFYFYYHFIHHLCRLILLCVFKDVKISSIK